MYWFVDAGVPAIKRLMTNYQDRYIICDKRGQLIRKPVLKPRYKLSSPILYYVVQSM